MVPIHWKYFRINRFGVKINSERKVGYIMKIVMLAGGGGSGGLKGYIKGFLSAANASPEISIIVICTEHFSKVLTNLPQNVKLVPMREAEARLSDHIKKKPLNPELIHIVEKEHPDIIYFTNSIIQKGLEHYPTILEMHNQLYIDSKQLWRQGISKTTFSLAVQRHFARKSIQRADVVVFDSFQSRDQCLSARINCKHSIVSYFGVAESERKFLMKSDTLHVPLRFIYISTIFPYKNQIPLLYGFSELKSRGYKFTLDLVGSGPDRYVRQVKKVIAKLDLTNQVVLHNWVEHDKVKDMIDQSDIFVYASSIETSGFGLMEGMARGAVIACNQESCLPEILGDGGLLFDVNSPSSIANTLQRLIDDPILRAELSQKAYQNSLQYTWENHNRKLFDELQQWLKERQKT